LRLLLYIYLVETLEIYPIQLVQTGNFFNTFWRSIDTCLMVSMIYFSSMASTRTLLTSLVLPQNCQGRCD